MSTLRPLTVPLLFLAATLFAAASPRADAQTSHANSAQTVGSKVSSDSDLHAEVEQLRQLVNEQQKRIEALEVEHKQDPPSRTSSTTVSQKASFSPEASLTSTSIAAPTLNAPLSAPVSPDARTLTPVGQSVLTQGLQSGSTDERVRNLERQIKGLGPISFSGDVRLRGEGFFGGPANESLDRFRVRIRARFNAMADLGSQFRTGIALASGDVNDPTSTNQNLTGFYTRKVFALDQAFVEYHPSWFKPLALTGGKFRYPWYNTELTWDKDLNPEGAAETLGFTFESNILKRLAFIGFELPFAEVAGTSATNQRINQQVTYGGQVQASFQIAPHLLLSAYSGYYDFRGADAVALALAKASSKNPQTPLTGALPLNTGSPVQDSAYTTTASTVITIGGTAYPTGVTSVTSAQFASKFGLFDNIARFDIDTGHLRWPIAFIGDYVQNTEACSNLSNILAVPANTSTTTYKQTVNSPCVTNQRRGYWLEGRVGRLQEKKDLQLGYTRIYIEREAVLGNFNYSELRQGTNVTEHRFDFFYQFDRSVQLGFTALVGRPLASIEPWLTRLQFDTIYIF